MQASFPLDRFPAGNSLSQDYLASSPRVRSWYHHDISGDTWAAVRIAELSQRSFPERGRLTESIVGRMKAWGASEKAIAAAQNLANPETFAVTTGQQTGLLGGPLYSQLKAMAVILHSRRLAKQFPNLRFVPVFGMAAVDSDFEEVRSATLLNRSLTAESISLAPRPADDNAVIAARDVAAELPALLEQLDMLLPDGDNARQVLEDLKASYCDGSLVNGFARWMLRIFADTELVLIDTSDPQYLRSSAGLLLRQLEQASEALAVTQARNSEIEAAGYSLQVDSGPGDLQLFWLDERQQRRKLQFADGRLSLRDGGTEIDHAGILRMAQDCPERFVPGALLGPLWQDNMLPNVAWVGGMAEIAYRAQSSALYEFHGLRMAPSFLRCTATLLPRRQAQQLAEFGWELPELYRPLAELEALAVESLRPRELDGAISRYLETLQGADAELLEIALGIDAGLEQSFATLRGNILQTADKLEKKITSALKRHNETITRRAASLHGLAFPGMQPQERVLSYVSFLARYGFGLTAQLMEQLDPMTAQHRVLIID